MTIASYNWDNRSYRPKIAVPGVGKSFVKLDIGTRGDMRYAMNRDRPASKDSNLDAMFTAVRLLNPGFKMSDYDIATDLGAISGLFNICLQIVNAIREKAGEPPTASAKSSGHNYESTRIDVQKVGTTLLLVREKPEFRPARGIGPEFRRVCGQIPRTEPMQGNPLEIGLANGIYRMVYDIRFGNLKILLADEVNAVIYPSQTGDGAIASGDVGGIGINVTLGGYKGDLNALTPVSFATLGVGAWKRLHPGKWLNQHLCNAPYRYVGRQRDGVVDEEPRMMGMNEVRDLCDLDKPGADLWAKVLECVLLDIVKFAHVNFETSDEHPVCHFSIVVEPEPGVLKIHKYKEAWRTDAVSTAIKDYLLGTMV